MPYNVFKFPAPEQGWPELVRTDEPDEPRECNFKPITCPQITSCSRCEHASEQHLDIDK